MRRGVVAVGGWCVQVGGNAHVHRHGHVNAHGRERHACRLGGMGWRWGRGQGWRRCQGWGLTRRAGTGIWVLLPVLHAHPNPYSYPKPYAVRCMQQRLALSVSRVAGGNTLGSGLWAGGRGSGEGDRARPRGVVTEVGHRAR